MLADNIQPWSSYGGQKYSVFSAVLHKFRKNKSTIDVSTIDLKHNVQCVPEFLINFEKPCVTTAFYNLLHYLLHHETQIDVLVTEKNKRLFTLSCEGSKVLEIATHIDLKTLVTEVDYIQSIWSGLSVDSFRQAIDIFHENYYLTDQRFLYHYEASQQFIKDISTVTDVVIRTKIITQVIKKLTLSFPASCVDKSLQDECVNNKYRFRITRSCRVEYTMNNNVVRLIHYYPESKHDVGLRHT